MVLVIGLTAHRSLAACVSVGFADPIRVARLQLTKKHEDMQNVILLFTLYILPCIFRTHSHMLENSKGYGAVATYKVCVVDLQDPTHKLP